MGGIFDVACFNSGLAFQLLAGLLYIGFLVRGLEYIVQGLSI